MTYLYVLEELERTKDIRKTLGLQGKAEQTRESSVMQGSEKTRECRQRENYPGNEPKVP